MFGVEVAELPVFHCCDAEHHPYASLVRELPVHFVFPRALPIWLSVLRGAWSASVANG